MYFAVSNDTAVRAARRAAPPPPRPRLAGVAASDMIIPYVSTLSDWLIPECRLISPQVCGEASKKSDIYATSRPITLKTYKSMLQRSLQTLVSTVTSAYCRSHDKHT
jgi:hypothetical protein